MRPGRLLKPYGIYLMRYNIALIIASAISLAGCAENPLVAVSAYAARQEMINALTDGYFQMPDSKDIPSHLKSHSAREKCQSIIWRTNSNKLCYNIKDQ